MRSIFQNFWYILKKFKTSSILNLLGLSVSLALFTVSFLQAEYDFSYDTVFKKHKNIYQLFLKMNNSDVEFPVITAFIAEKMANDFAEVKNYCIATYMGADMPESDFTVLNEESVQHGAHYVEVTSGFLDVFTPEITSGNIKKIFEGSNYALISENTAKKIFGEKDPVGEVLIKKDNSLQLTIAAVYKDFPERCSFVNGIYAKMPETNDDPNNFNLDYYGYFKIDKVNIDTLTTKINNNWLTGFISTFISEQRFVPLNEVHYTVDGGSRNITLSLLAIGILILIISYINFINFSVALAPARIRELNIRKILGEKNTKMRFTIAFEACLFSLVSFVLSLFIIYFINNSFINELLSADLTLQNNAVVFLLLAFFVGIIGFIIGLYPAFYITNFQPATVLNGKLALSGKGAGLRNTLVTIQFFASITLIILSFLFKMQHDFMHKESWKFERDNIVYVPTDQDAQHEAFFSDLKTNPDISDYTYSSFLPGEVGAFIGTTYKQEKVITLAAWDVAHNFLDFFGIPIAEGKNFSNDTTRQIIINKKVITDHELENEDLLGNYFISGATTAGIIDNITFQSLDKPIGTLAFFKGYSQNTIRYILIKINGQNTEQVIDFIEQSWKKTHTENFDIHFLNEAIDKQYKKQNELAKLITLFGFLSLLIALMGVYGMVIFNGKYKAKEIAIRKVNGSTVKEIIFMLNKTILIQLGIAFIVAVPVSYYIINKWLENFAFKIHIYWWVFLLSLIIVLIITTITVSYQSYKSATANPIKALNNE